MPIRDTQNSTTTPLAASETFTGVATDVMKFYQIHVTMKYRPNVVPDGDASTAVGSLFVDFGPDGTNWDIQIPILVRNGIFIPQTYIFVDKFFRVRYVNDGGAAAIASLGSSEVATAPVDQTQFRLNSYLLEAGTKGLGRTIDQSVSGSDPVEITRSVIMGLDPDGTYSNALVSADKEVYTTTSESDLNVYVLLSRTGIASTAYAILVDLSDTTNFPHSMTGRIDISHIKIVLELANNSLGRLRIGVITAIDGTDADISYLFSVPFTKSAVRRVLSINSFSPSQLKFGVTGGALDYAITNATETTASVNTGSSLDSPRGTTTVTPAVGDVIVKYEHTSGSAWDGLVEAFYGSHD